MNTRTRIVRLTWLAVVLSTVMIVSGCSALQANPPETLMAQPEQDFPPVISVTGKVVPERWANLSLATPGILAEILVAPGENVEAGQALLRLAGGDPDAPAPDLKAALQAAALEVQAAQHGMEELAEAADAARLAAELSWAAAAAQIRDLELQLEAMEIPEAQEALTPEEAYDLARSDYQDALAAFEPYRDEPRSDATRQERLEALDQAREDYDAAVRRLQLSMGLDSAEVTLAESRRNADLYAAGPLPEDLALAQARLDAAQAALEAAQTAISTRILQAPFSGTVTEIYVRVGEWVAPGMAVLALADLTGLRVEITDLNEIDMAQVQIGDAVRVYFDALPDTTVEGEVVYISPQAAQGAGVNYPALIELAQLPQGLRWGMSAFVDITLER